MLRAIAFYLPQFHPIPQNDAWWGPGFTEWRNAARALPNWEGHYQPHVPSELGAYDLRDVEVQLRQAKLAKAHGLSGFCFYYYWFGGKRVLERPVEQWFENKDIDFPFCVCWANENWTRTWDGKEKDILLAQNHSPEDDEAFLRSVIPLLKDPRYIRVDGRPLLAVYRVDLFPDMRQTAERWRRIAASEGLPGLHLCAVQFYGIDDPRPWGFDAAIEFPPHKYIGPENQPDAMPTFTNPNFAGGVLDYPKIVSQALLRQLPDDYIVYRGVIPSWDNTARRQHTPHIIINSSPLDYQHWLRAIVEQTRRIRTPENQILFVNAWNEWGEGCHLEPDVKYGRAYLEATRAALQGFRAIDELLSGIRALANGDRHLVEKIVDAFDARERSLYALQQVVRRKNEEIEGLRSLAQPAQENGLALLLRAAKDELRKHPRLKRALKTALRRQS